MARSERAHRVKRRLQGVAFLVVVASLLGLTVAVYNKSLPWQSSAEVILEADRVGNQLVVPADVKLNGVLVGRVSGVSSNGRVARMRMQLDKSQIKHIPANAVARILPKTLFGEKYVELVVPPDASPQPLRAGDVIRQDRSRTAIELQTVFDDLVPVLRALKPAQLSVALDNLSTALRGRGDALGHNLELVNENFTRFNRALPDFTHDISALADVASAYADATPDLMSTLRNFTANARTVTEKQDTYAQFLAGSAGFARTAADVFGENADRLIRLAHVSAPVAKLYARYSIVLECLPNGLAIYDRTRLEQVFGPGNYLHITLTPVGDRGPYTPADRPTKSDLTALDLPPNCYGLPYGNHDLHPVMSRYPGPHPTDNYQCAGYTAPPTCPAAPPSGGSAATSSQPRRGAVGSRDEQQTIAGLLAPLLGDDAGDAAGLQDLLMGPLLRGMAVSVS